jgi:hypothetical protein
MADMEGILAWLADNKAMNAGDAATALNAPIVVTVDTPIIDILRVFINSNQWPAIVLRSEVRPATPAVYAAIQAVAIKDVALAGAMSVIDTTQADKAAFLDKSLDLLVEAGDITEDTITAIKALRNKNTTLANQFEFFDLTAATVKSLREHLK